MPNAINAPVFLRAAEDISLVVEKLFNHPEKKSKPQIKAVIQNSRDAVRKAYTERGTGTQTLMPLIAIKPTSIGVQQENQYNSFVLKEIGKAIAEDSDGNTYYFRGRQVELQFSLTLFTHSFAGVLEFIHDAMLLKSELHYYSTIEPGIKFPNLVYIDTSAFTVPEMQAESEIAPFEFEFTMRVFSYSGVIELVPRAKTVNVGGGLIVVVDGKKVLLGDDIAILKAE